MNLININIDKDVSHFSVMLPGCDSTNIFSKSTNFECRYFFDEVIEKISSLIFNKKEFNKMNNDAAISNIKSELVSLLEEINYKNILRNNIFGIKFKFYGKTENYLLSPNEIFENI
jgi:hypothetical protein